MQQTDNHTQDNNLFPTDTWQFAIDPSTLMVQDSAEALLAENEGKLPFQVWKTESQPITMTAKACEMEWELNKNTAAPPPQSPVACVENGTGSSEACSVRCSQVEVWRDGDIKSSFMPFVTNTNLQESSSRITINMEVDTPRGRSVSSSANSSRSASALSNVSSKAYVDRIQELSNSPAWAEQVENEVFQPTPLSYATGENVSTNQVPNVELNRAPIEAASNNTCSTQGLEPSVIPYTANQPADSQLWDGNFCPISIFGMNEYLEGDARNINCSLHRISAFIRQRKLEDKSAEDIPQITEFGFVAWAFLSSIYESGWDKLEANKDKKSFC